MNNIELLKQDFFITPIYFKEDTSWLKKLNKNSDLFIKQAIKINKLQKVNAHHSKNLIKENNFKDFKDFIELYARSILNDQGYDLKDFNIITTELWVQEFPKNGFGYHSPHSHWNGHISGFYFLKCSEKTSFPVFHDPRISKTMIQLPQKDNTLVTLANDKINCKPKPGTFIFFNSYLIHEFILDYGIDPFRFIHFNIQAIPHTLR